MVVLLLVSNTSDGKIWSFLRPSGLSDVESVIALEFPFGLDASFHVAVFLLNTTAIGIA